MTRERKLLSIDDLVVELANHRADNLRIVLCHGVFDLMHIGHIRHLEQAKRLGDLLVVTITPDRFVNKGTGRPAFPEQLRAEVIASLDCVDYVAVNGWPTAVEAIQLLRPHVFAKGGEYEAGQDSSGHISVEKEAIVQIGGAIAFTHDCTFSSSALINHYLYTFPPEVSTFLRDFAGTYTASDVLQYLTRAASLKVLVIGEAIIDEYQYCEAIGKSGKEPVLATRFLSAEKYAGGVLACANHLAGVCNSVDVLTFLGAGGAQEDFIRDHLKPNVRPTFLYKQDSPTISKVRFVERYLSQKMFEVYHMNDRALTPEEETQFCDRLHNSVSDYDVVIVADYGHGMIGPEAVEILCTQAPFLAVNTQANAGNNGFNTISKYPRADYICLAQREYALETRTLHLAAEEMIRHVAGDLACPRAVLTQGKFGCISYTVQDGCQRTPALTTQVVDRVGAGDAVFCLTALCAALDAPAAVIGFLGNVIGAEAVQVIGNQRSIERTPLFRHVEYLLKTHQSDRATAPRLRPARNEVKSAV